MAVSPRTPYNPLSTNPMNLSERVKMVIKVDISPEVQAHLAARAKAEGLTLEDYAEKLLLQGIGADSVPNGMLSTQDLHAMLSAIGQGSENLPRLPTTAFIRQSFYGDRP